MEDKQKLIDKVLVMAEESKEVQEDIEKKIEKQLAVEELEKIGGIGDSTAEQIVDQLSERGLEVEDLVSFEDMTEIKGIGEAMAGDIRQYFEDEDGEEPESKEEKPSESEVEESSEDKVAEAEQKEGSEEQSGVSSLDEDRIESGPTARKFESIKKQHSGAAQKYMGKTRQ